MTDLLAQAIGAARAEAEVGADDGAATRLRIRESIAKRGSKRRLWTLLAAALGTMFASTAFALQAGWEPPWSSKTEAVAPAAPDPDPSATPDAPRRTSRASSDPSTTVRFESVPPLAPSGANQAIADEAPLPSPPAVADPTPAREPLPPLPSVANPSSARPTLPSSAPATAASAQKLRTEQPATASVVPPRRAPAPSQASSAESSPATASIEPPATTSPSPAPKPEPAPAVVAPVPDAELAAYRTAHALHFRGNDPKAALAAWDAVLAKFPSGRLAPEARFNRALTLIKLSRWADARAALTPFAAGGYRQKEATQLLEAIANR